MSARKLFLGLVSLFLLVVAQACQRPDEATVSQQDGGTPHVIREHYFPGINHIANLAQAGFVGQVLEVSAARWNSVDGSPWQEGPGSKVTATTFRDSKVQVQRVVFETPEFPLEEGDMVPLRLWGDGTPTGDSVSLPDTNVRVFENQIEGEFVTGQTVFLLVGNEPFPMESGWENSNRIVGNLQGNWTVRNETAVSVSPKRTVPLEALIGRILQERSIGKNPERDRNTQGNPLG